MGRGPKKWNASTIERYRLEGRGLGEGSGYQPWVKVSDFSSLGTSRRPYGIKTQREHHILSDGEWYLFLLLEWPLDVVDIREQFPLDYDLTQEIAAAIGVSHPCYPYTHVPAVLTVDFLVTLLRHGKRTLAAFNVKLESDLEVPGTLEKLEISRAYLDGAGIPHHLVLKERLPRNKVANLAWIYGARLKTGEVEAFPGQLEDLAPRMAADLRERSSDITLTEYCANFDARCVVEPGTGLRVARLLMDSRTLIPDLDCQDVRDAPLLSFQLAAPAGKIQLIGDK